MKNKFTKVLSVILVLACISLTLAACSPAEAIDTSLYAHNILPAKTNTHDLGSLLYQWNNGYFKQVYLDGVLLTPGSGSGSVTSVGLSLPTEFTISGSPVTISGTLGGAWKSETAKYFFAAPNAADGAPSFRAILASDIPALSYVVTEVDPVFTSSPAFGITAGDIITWNSTGTSPWVADPSGIHYSLGSVGINTSSVANDMLTIYSNAGGAGNKALDVSENSASAGAFGIDVTVAGAKTDNTYGQYIYNAATSGTAAIDKYGLYIRSDSVWNGTATRNISLYIDTPVGGTQNYSIYSLGGLNYLGGATELGSTLTMGGNINANGNTIIGSTGYNGLVVTANTGVITTGTWQASSISTAYTDAKVVSESDPIVASKTGIITASGGIISSITDSHTNWDTAYTDAVTSWTLPLQFTTGTASIVQADSAHNGYLTSTDWGVFNGKGAGTCTSVGLSLPTEFTVTNSPVTGSGTLTGTWKSETAKYFFAAPNAADGTPSFRAILASDIPALSYVVTEVDPVFTGSPANGIAAGNITAWNTATGYATGRLVGQSVLTSGTSFTTNAATTHILIQMLGGGGGGAGAPATGLVQQVVAGCGGNAGAYAEKYFTVVGNTTYTYAIGAAGTGGSSGGDSSAGGSTTFAVGAVTVTAPGGAGTSYIQGTTFYIGVNTSSSTSTSGDINGATTYAKYAFIGLSTVGLSGGGGDSIWGRGGRGRGDAGNGIAGAGYGSGGGGGFNNVISDPARDGGAGTQGIILVWEFS